MNSSVIDQQTLQFGRLLHYAGLAVVLVVGATTYSWLYSPLVNSITETQLQIEDLEIMSRNTPVIRAEHSRLTEHLQEIEERYAALEARVPLNAEAGNFLRQVSQIAQDQQLAISNFQPAQTTRSSGYAAMEVRLEGQGTFPSICSFFGRLAEIQRLSKVKDLTINVDANSDEYPMRATIVIYFGLRGEQTAAIGREVRRG